MSVQSLILRKLHFQKILSDDDTVAPGYTVPSRQKRIHEPLLPTENGYTEHTEQYEAKRQKIYEKRERKNIVYVQQSVKFIFSLSKGC